MRRLGNPQADLSCVHIAGTNGKGSVTAYISTMLAADHHRVGVYTSPYLERFSERIRVLDGAESLDRFLQNDSEGEIPERELTELSDRVECAVEGMLADREEHPTEFELVTAVAFLYFEKMECDFVVLETGLGGRLDSTNIIQKSVFSVITALGFDHMDRLGDTMRAISREKAGIVKPGCPVFLYSPDDTGLSDADAAEVTDIITNTCRKLGSSLTIVSSSDVTLISNSVDGQIFSVPFLEKELRIRLIGDYQLHNAALAARSVLDLVSERGIREGLSRTVWKGRMEVFRKVPLILLDGGHNPQGARSFRDSVDALFLHVFQKHPPRLILGFMEDKDYPQILSILFSDLAYRYMEILCVTPENPRALSAEVLKNYIIRHFEDEALFYKNPAAMYNEQGKISAFDHVQTACDQAWNDSLIDGLPILCVGSLYLAGQVRGAMKHEP